MHLCANKTSVIFQSGLIGCFRGFYRSYQHVACYLNTDIIFRLLQSLGDNNDFNDTNPKVI